MDERRTDLQKHVACMFYLDVQAASTPIVPISLVQPKLPVRTQNLTSPDDSTGQVVVPLPILKK